MPALKLRGIDNLSSNSSGTFYYEGSKFGTAERVPQWWDRKQSPAYIWVNRIHITRSCGDIDMLIPMAYDLSLKIRYDGDVGFEFDKFRSCKRVGLTDSGSNEVWEEYIMPNHPGRAPTHRVITPLISCFTSTHVVGFFDYYQEEIPMNAGDLSPTDAHYDLNVGNLNFDLN